MAEYRQIARQAHRVWGREGPLYSFPSNLSASPNAPTMRFPSCNQSFNQNQYITTKYPKSQFQVQPPSLLIFNNKIIVERTCLNVTPHMYTPRHRAKAKQKAAQCIPVVNKAALLSPHLELLWVTGSSLNKSVAFHCFFFNYQIES